MKSSYNSCAIIGFLSADPILSKCNITKEDIYYGMSDGHGLQFWPPPLIYQKCVNRIK